VTEENSIESNAASLSSVGDEGSASLSGVKKKRAYTKRENPAPIVAAPAPEPVAAPSPAVTALEGDILELVKLRGGAIQAISVETQQVASANGRLAAAREYLSGLEKEVEYRMNLIAQMKGQRPQTSYSAPLPFLTPSPIMPQFDMANEAYNQLNQASSYAPQYGVPAGVSSIPPAMPSQNLGHRERGPRTESAEGFRDQETGVRAAI
jgi:hypothetical protein